MSVTAAAMLLLAAPAAVQTPPAASPPPVSATGTGEQVVIESYYRIRWGSSAEFLRLWRANHEPLLRAMQQAGYLVSVEVEEPAVHLADGPRWDLRVTIAWRDAAVALGTDRTFDTAWTAATRRLFPRDAEFRAAETRRFGLLEEHWDVIVRSVPAG